MSVFCVNSYVKFMAIIFVRLLDVGEWFLLPAAGTGRGAPH